MRYFVSIFILVCIGVVGMLGFRGSKFQKTPLYIFPDMDWQAKFLPQTPNPFFKDGRSDRQVIAGSIPRGNASEIGLVFAEAYSYEPGLNPSKYSGKESDGDWVRGFPVEVNEALMQLGKQKYDIFCTVCHGAVGDGNGITKEYGMIATPSYHDDRLRAMAEGEIFNTITHGKGLMLSYADKLNPEERWAVILYLRALQAAGNVPADSVSESVIEALKQKELEEAGAAKEEGATDIDIPKESPDAEDAQAKTPASLETANLDVESEDTELSKEPADDAADNLHEETEPAAQSTASGTQKEGEGS